LHQPNPLLIKALQKVLSALKAAHQQRVQTEQLCIALKAAMEKVHGDHKHNKAVVVDLELVVEEAVAVVAVEEAVAVVAVEEAVAAEEVVAVEEVVAAEEAVAAVAAEEAETTKTLLSN
jgi:hypothetical protein